MKINNRLYEHKFVNMSIYHRSFIEEKRILLTVLENTVNGDMVRGEHILEQHQLIATVRDPVSSIFQ